MSALGICSMTAPRCVRPEILDDLAPEDPQALRSRRDLRRVHRAMRSVSALNQALLRLRLAARPQSILELGAGDGSLLLRFAAALSPRWPAVQLTLLDRQPIVSSATVESYRRLGWDVKTVCEDVLAWARRSALETCDLCVATLFLHHFQESELRELLRGVAARSRAFIAIEPRREMLAKVGSRLVGLLGTNAVTREDAVKSVDAGFTGQEITAAWPSTEEPWWMQEFRVLPFSHGFIAAREAARIMHE
jgi:SAM-dependent methyltransferase